MHIGAHALGFWSCCTATICFDSTSSTLQGEGGLQVSAQHAKQPEAGASGGQALPTAVATAVPQSNDGAAAKPASQPHQEPQVISNLALQLLPAILYHTCACNWAHIHCARVGPFGCHVAPQCESSWRSSTVLVSLPAPVLTLVYHSLSCLSASAQQHSTSISHG